MYKFKATVTMSRLPVRSPLPKRVPSTRSAPAINPSSVAATPVPRSLCVCKEMIALLRSFKLRQNHSIWSACTFGVATSTVAGRFKMILLASVGCQTCITASQISNAYSTSVSEKLSGEYWSRTWVPGTVSTSPLINCAPSIAICLIASLLLLKVTRRWRGEVELYKCTIALGTPSRLSKVRRIKCSRAWTSTCKVTSAGMRFSSTSRRMKLNSVSLADGKPTSISLKPVATSNSKNSTFSSTFMGMASAWLPSRRSTLAQMGARSIIWSGHVRLGKWICGKGRYLEMLPVCMVMLGK